MKLLIKDNYFELWCCNIMLSCWIESFGIIPLYECVPCTICKSDEIFTEEPYIARMLGKEKLAKELEILKDAKH